MPSGRAANVFQKVYHLALSLDLVGLAKINTDVDRLDGYLVGVMVMGEGRKQLDGKMLLDLSKVPRWRPRAD